MMHNSSRLASLDDDPARIGDVFHSVEGEGRIRRPTLPFGKASTSGGLMN